MMASYKSQPLIGANDECDLLIGGKQSYSKQGNKVGPSGIGDSLDDEIEDNHDDDDQEDRGFNLPSIARTQKPSLMKLLWMRMKNTVPVGNEDDFERDWTLDSGIVYRPVGGGKSSMGSSLNNSNQKSRWLFDRSWLGGGGGGGKSRSHAFRLTKDESNLRRSNNPNLHHPNQRDGLNCRMLLSCAVSFLLLAASLLVLVKLMNLLQESQSMGQMFLRKSPATTTVSSRSDSSFYGPDGVDGSYTEHEARLAAERDSGRWIVATNKCRIPNIDPWDESIAGYIDPKPAYNCTDVLITKKANGQPGGALTFVSGNKLFFTERAIKWGAMQECCYKQVTRSEENDRDLVYSEICQPINENGLKAPADLVQVQCDKLNYTNVHPFVVHEPEEEAASRRVAARKLDPQQYYNVILLGVDTISRLNGFRQLNRTLGLLRDKYNTLEFTGYNKVGENTFPNIVPFLTGLKPEQLVETQCWLASNYSQESETGDDFLDNCKYLWNFYQDFGYLTYFSEDWPAASTFNYLKQGFKRQPTTYYGRPFTLARDKLLLPPVKMGCSSPCLWDKSIAELDLSNLATFIEEHKDVPHFAFHWMNCPQHDDLNGASRIDDLLANFFERIYDVTQANRTFVIFFSDHGYRWNNFVSTRVGHYEASLPMLTIAPPKHFIENHPNLYENLKRHTSTLLTPFDMFRTLIDIRNVGAKHLEKASRGRHNVKAKKVPSLHSKSTRKAVSTPAPKVDELGYTIGPTASTTIRQLRMQDGSTYKHSFKTISLLNRYNFSETDRSCIEAGIPDNYCVCHEFSHVSESTNDVVGAAYYLVYVHMYSTIRDHLKLCHLLDLEKVHEAEYFDFKLMKSAKSRRRRGTKDSAQTTTKSRPKTSLTTTAKPPHGYAGDEQSEEYLPNGEYNIRFSTRPGGALFQEVVRFNGDDRKACEMAVEKVKEQIEDPSEDYDSKISYVEQFNGVCRFSVHSDSISRLNLYRDQSQCIKNNIEIKKVCYCNDLLDDTKQS